MELLVLVAAIIVLGVLANLVGADTRPGFWDRRPNW